MNFLPEAANYNLLGSQTSITTPLSTLENVLDPISNGIKPIQVAAIITVNSIADVVDDFDGMTTLREAINFANADATEDVILFETTLFATPQTITLSLGQLNITHNLSIEAPRDSLTGENLVTVSGNNATPVFEIEKEATVNLNGLIVADGNVIGDKGGGIKNSGTLTLENSVVRNTSGNLSNGAGIFVDNGATLTVSNSIISGNRFSGIHNANGIVNVINSTLIRNGVGGILNYGTTNVSNSHFQGNSSGIYNQAGTVNVSNCNISGNISYTGGGIVNFSTMNVSDSTISGNRANYAGGIYNNGTMTVSNSTISDNSEIASSGFRPSGGGIYNYGNVTVSNSTISSNRATYGGGGIDNYGTVLITNSTLDGNSATNNGGGINNSGISTVLDSTIIGNSADNGGGIYNNYTGTLTLVFSTLTQNLATNGSGVYQNSVPLQASDRLGSNSVRNTIIAANLVRDNGVNPDVFGNFTSFGYNLIGSSTGSSGFGVTGDIFGTSDNPIDPRLAPLDFYGGSTQTIALLSDSPAIDAGDPTVLDTDPTTDQRGFPRVSGGRADIGAFEFFIEERSLN